MSEIQISVGVVTFNHEKYIRQCLESIINQQCNTNFEVLVGDDGSTDGTAEICREFEERYPNKVRYFVRSGPFSQAGELRTATSNFLFLVNKARGTYYAHCDGDDFWMPEKMETQLNFIKENALGACYTNAIKFKNNEEVGLFRPETLPEIIPDKPLTVDFILPSQFSTLLFKKALSIHFPNWMMHTFSTDTPVFLTLQQHTKIGYINQPLSYYRVHEKGMMQHDIKRQLNFYTERIKEFEIYRKYNTNYKMACNYWLAWFKLSALALKQENWLLKRSLALLVLVNTGMFWNRKIIKKAFIKIK